MDRAATLVKDDRGSTLVEFAIVLPILVVFAVGIYDFSSAFNEKQRIAQAAQVGAVIAGAQPMSDIQTANGSPNSLQPVVTAVFNSLASSGVLPKANTGLCKMPPPVPTQVPSTLTWVYTIDGCGLTSDELVITINRGLVVAGSPATVDTVVTVTFPYHWQLFGRVIQLIVPGPNAYSARVLVTESATVHNQT